MAGYIPSWPISEGVSLIKEIVVACRQTHVEMTALAVVIFYFICIHEIKAPVWLHWCGGEESPHSLEIKVQACEFCWL